MNIKLFELDLNEDGFKKLTAGKEIGYYDFYGCCERAFRFARHVEFFDPRYELWYVLKDRDGPNGYYKKEEKTYG